MTDVKMLERGDDWQCPSMEERERARNEIHQIIHSVITTTCIKPSTTVSTTTTFMPSVPDITAAICGGPGWRHVAFINMTDMHQLQMLYWTQFDNIFQEDLWTVTHNSRRMFFNHIQRCMSTIQPCVWEDKGIPVWCS